MTMKARVHAGRLVVDEPTDLPEGTEVELLPLDPGDWLDEADRAALHKALRESDADVAAGRLVEAEEILEEPEPTLAGVRAGAYFPIMLDWRECPAVERVPGKVSGVWLFTGTRVPVKALFENLESGARIDEFLEWFPGVTREQVEAVLEHTERSLALA
jgi:uncharacterized protein (DUF433 family)